MEHPGVRLVPSLTERHGGRTRQQPDAEHKLKDWREYSNLSCFWLWFLPFPHMAAEISALAIRLAHCHCAVGNRWGTQDISLK